MRKAFVCLIALLVLAGCAQQAAQDTGAAQQDTQPEAAADTTPAETQEPPAQSSYVLSDELRNTVNEQLEPGVKVVMPLAYAKLSYGEASTFGIGIQNLQTLADEFLIKVYFDEAYDKYTNPISTDEDTMNRWIKTNLPMFTLDSMEKDILSFTIEAGDIQPGVKPAPGSYVFDVEFLHKKGGYHANKDYVGKKEVTIKI